MQELSRFRFYGNTERPGQEREELHNQGKSFSESKYEDINFEIICTQGIADRILTAFGMAGDGGVYVEKLDTYEVTEGVLIANVGLDK